MLTRALIVMLVVLNLGVAAWWWWRPAPPPSADDALRTSGIARLQLLQERRELAGRASPSATDAAASAAAPTKPLAASAAATDRAVADETAADQAGATPNPDPDTETAAAAERCYRFGPFADDAALAAARNALQPRAVRLREQSAAAPRGRGWRVVIGPLNDRAEANALAERIKQAGFGDLFVTGQGTEPAAIALGQFSNEDRAQRHATNLRDAGFAARAEPLGGAEPAARWLLVAAAANFDAAAARRASTAAQAGAIDCAALR